MDSIFLKARDKDSHKGNFGKVLVIAGSLGMAGAAYLTGKAAIKSGAGIVRFFAPREIFDILQIMVPEATCIDRTVEDIDLNEYEAIAIGPGLGKGKENISIIKKVLNEYSGTLILDADAINCIMKYSLYGNVTLSNANIIMTPHRVEAARLLEIESIEDEYRVEAGKEISKAFDATVVMKGANSLVVNDEMMYVNSTGNPGMATGGSGDVLTGIIAALSAQGYDSFDAAKIGVYVHGFAGDLCKDKIGELGMTAVDIMEMTPMAFKNLEKVK